MMNKRRPILPLLLLSLLATLLLGGCGFQPRGQAPAIAASLAPLAITGIDSDTRLYQALRRQLGDQLTGNEKQAAAVLVISRTESRSELLTVGADNRGNEYELIEGLSFQVRQGGKTSAPQRLAVNRLHHAPGSAVLAERRAEEELRDSMHRQLAEQLMRRLAAWQ